MNEVTCSFNVLAVSRTCVPSKVDGNITYY